MGEPEASDQALIDACRRASGDRKREIAGQLFDRHYIRVGRWCLRFTRDRERAADLAQTVFMKAYAHLDTFQGASQFSTWLYAIARHEHLAGLRGASLRHEESDEEALIDAPTAEAGPDREAERASNARYAHRLLAATLDDVERRVFTLHYGDAMPLDEITHLLRLTNASGAKAFIVSAKRKLARATRRIEARGGRV